MITFNNWRIAAVGSFFARQYDNLTRELRIEGNIPNGWDWDLLVQAGKNFDIIRLAKTENGLTVTLTAEMLSVSGPYTIQLRSTQGEKVRHTNIINIFVPESLSGDAQWPEVPSEFTQIEEIIRELYAHPPIPGDNGFWLTWDVDTDQYIESAFPFPEIYVGPPGPPGPKGKDAISVATDGYYAFNINDEGNLIVSYTDTPPNARINENGHLILEV